MANDYTSFAALIGVDNQEQCDWIMAKLSDVDEDVWIASEIYPVTGGGWYLENCPLGVFVGDSEGGDIDRLVEIVAEYQTTFNIKRCWGMEWAFTCSKLRVDAFGGGAAFVAGGVVQYNFTNEWLQERTKECE